jgi:ectoine hydroxylase-related dioxygenase (phytanoyl-CoA dioxygenase family)
MGSARVQMFHDHVLVKEPGTAKPTPWHQDGPYYFVDGRQTVSFWCPVDPVREASLRCVAGSHLWPKEVLPTRWVAETAFYPDPERYMPVPDPDAEGMPVLEWEMEPGDAVAFTSEPCTARAAIRPPAAAAPFHCAFWAMMHVL